MDIMVGREMSEDDLTVFFSYTPEELGEWSSRKVALALAAASDHEAFSHVRPNVRTSLPDKDAYIKEVGRPAPVWHAYCAELLDRVPISSGSGSSFGGR